ncbi:hypothetical protein HYR53_04280 [Candidatus Acetothermia bacterium]|nr:hypothetical protein [Candidatus Acetothermia bacterium]
MKMLLIRITPEELTIIDRKVRSGLYQSRSKAIRDYIRKAEGLESLAQSQMPAEEEVHLEEEVWEDEGGALKEF